MDLDEALAVVFYLKDRPQTHMTGELRAILRDAQWVANEKARIVIEGIRASQVPDTVRGE